MTATAPSRDRPTRAPTSDGALRAALEPALMVAATRPGPTLASALLPVRPMDPIALFRAAQVRGEDVSLWLQPGEGFAHVAVGSAWSVQAEGRGRFAAIDSAWSQLCSEAALPSRSDTPYGCGPLLCGGFGFADAAATEPAWRRFEGAAFTLPTYLVTTTQEGTWLTSSRLMGDGDEVSSVARELVATWQALTAAAATPSQRAADPVRLRLVARRPDAAIWRDAVARLAGAVGRGRIDKAVLARSVELVASASIDVAGVLEQLRLAAPESTVFAFARAGRVFLGATPERLVRLAGRALRTMAMAGSAMRIGDEVRDAQAAAELLGSDKEREEHEVVVAMLRETLAPVVERLEVAPVPHVEAFRHVQHLVTPVAGTLRGSVSLPRLAERLHPTPAVGGVPRDIALGLAADEEPFERGWYAAPVGWMDAHGDGELMVALRSGVVDGARAILFAGCGIMADSEPDREWEESEDKLRALWSALGGTDA